jgi:N-carbamoyl-L-amino-acid hydrolase
MDIRIDINRLRQDLEELGRIGREPGGGITRPSFSPADREAREWFKDRLEAAGLVYRRDGAGNQFGRLGGGTGRVVMAGSHLDTVPNGGMFDGASGVLAALECARRLQEEKVPLAKPVDVASFTDEEGNLVGDFLGSRAFVGLLNEAVVREGRTASGQTLAEAMAGTGLSVESVLGAHREKPDLAAYLELHIEQGPLLETEDVPIGIVETIAGKRYFWCSFLGQASHAGTTPMELRQDAFIALADFALRSTRHVAAEHYGSLVTVGKVALQPGSFSVVPGRADFSLDFRSPAPDALADVERELADIAADVAEIRGVRFAVKLIDATDPVSVPKRILSLLEEECERLDYRFLRMASGAGHDAQILAGVCDAGMIFVPSVDGLSHAPAEATNWDDLEKGANLLLGALLRLAT